MTEPSLTVTGLVHGEPVLSREALRSLPGAIDDGATGIISVPVGSILDAAGLHESATHGTVISSDGTYRASIPLGELQGGGWLAVPDDERDLRLTITGGRTLCWNVKDVGSINVSDHAEPDSVPENPPH